MITLTTDFGTRDAYVAAMKGVMLDLHPSATFVDITHEIHPQDVMEAAFVLRTAVPYMPAGTVHLVVVDPGVGTDRRAVAVQHDDQWFVGPDNGVFPLVLDDDAPDAMVELDVPDAWRAPDPSTTFHGRDIFAPVAAHLAAGRALDEVGSPIDALDPLRWALPIADEHAVEGQVIHVDRFGNCITNVRRDTLIDTPAARALNGAPDAPTVKCYAGSTILKGLHDTYGEVAEEEPLLLFGSTGFLEVAVNAGNAAERLNIRKGDSVKLTFPSSRS
jgi:S-adenosylmethionine hydrolase